MLMHENALDDAACKTFAHSILDTWSSFYWRG